MSDYGSGDDLFDDVDPDNFDTDADELFDGIDPDAISSSIPCPPSVSRKRTHQDGPDNNDPDSSAASKRQRSQAQPLDFEPDPAKMRLARRLLKDKFGHNEFRHEQEAAIERILHGKNTLVIFPTGAGKSLCYQIPAIAFEELDRQYGSRSAEESGITIVVSPLLALMKDQVDVLKRRGIPADTMDSTKTWEATQLIHAALRKGQLRILYCAPERLSNEGFVETMKHVRGGVRLIAIDEAHCISEWGHSFRPEYLKVARFAQEIEAERVVCLTATATPNVTTDVCKAFEIEPVGVFQTTPYRPNLNLQARAVKSKQDKYPLLFKFLTDHPGPSLVYVTQQEQSMSVASELRDQGFNARPFHAGMKTEEKQKIQDDFMANRVRIIVATIAFGMGIDKPDIRNIIHFDLSRSVEEYSQQIGRAGRDGKVSHCMFYLCPEDFYMREYFARGDLPSKESLKGLIKNIFNPGVRDLAINEVFKQNHYTQCRDYDIRLPPLQTVYATLELRFGLIRAITPEYTEYKFKATEKYFPVLRSDTSREGKAIFKSAKKSAIWYSIDPRAAADSGGVSRNEIVRKLTILNDSGIIELKVGGIEPRYRILNKLPRTETEINALVDDLFDDLERREEDAIRRTQQVYNLITGDKCMALALADHFGMPLPDNKSKCGHCIHCEIGHRIRMPPPPPKKIDAAGIQAVLKAVRVRDDPRFLARIAFGIKSPRVTRLKLDKSPVFKSLADHDWETLVREFTKECNP